MEIPNVVDGVLYSDDPNFFNNQLQNLVLSREKDEKIVIVEPELKSTEEQKTEVHDTDQDPIKYNITDYLNVFAKKLLLFQIKTHKFNELKRDMLNTIYELQIMTDKKNCCICMTNNNDTVLDCGHMYCNDCSKKIKKCSLCNASITNRIKVYY
jgi:hypothetical protein